MAPSSHHVAAAPLHRQPSHWREAIFPPVHRPPPFAFPNALIIHQGLRAFTADRQVIGASCAFTATTLLLAPQSAVLPRPANPQTSPDDLIFEITHCIILHLSLSWTLAFLHSPFPSFNLLYNKCVPSPSPLSSSIDNQAHEDKKVCVSVSDTP